MLTWSRSPAPAERAICFDLENRPLAYWYDGQTTSEITAFGWRFDGDKDVSTMMLRPGGCFECDDGQLLDYADAYQTFAEVISGADLVYGHNIRRHDLPMLNDTLMHRLKLPGLPPLRTSDTFKDLTRGRTMSVSLENLAALYGLSGDKMRMAQPDWEAANRLDDEGVSLARERVSSDVVLQAELRQVLVGRGVLGPPKWWRP
jgi:hypothetical protein